jgi:hypothetical protein
MRRAYLNHTLDTSFSYMTRCAYLAGIIDGEGCIGIGKRGRNRKYIIATLQVSNTDYRLLEWLQHYYGGGIYSYNHDNTILRGRKPTYIWSLAADKATNVIIDALPYLIIKREQAELVLSIPRREIYRDTVNGRIRVQMTEEDFFENERLFAEMRQLNKRGIGNATEGRQE